MRHLLYPLCCAAWTFLNPLLPATQAATLVVNTSDNHSGPDDGLLSLQEALGQARDGDMIQFHIPGPGPHFIETPMGGYPFITANGLTLDGYSQPGASANDRPFTGINNAEIRIVLDSSGDDTAESPYPDHPGLILHRSTRMLFEDGSDVSGYGDSENGILAVMGAQNFTVRGIGFLGRHTAGETSDPSIYGVALARGATGAKVQGCRFGLHPDGHTIKGFRAAVTGFRFRGVVDGANVQLFSSGLVFGSDGDGLQDRAEANLTMGMELALGLELPGARVSGNRFNVYPDGNTFLDIRAYAAEHDLSSIEILENGRGRENTLIGTDGLGISAADQRNVMAPALYKRMFEFYGGNAADHTVIAGNFIGVGVDGHTVYPFDPVGSPDLISMDGLGSVRIGSNADGRGDEWEPNFIQGLGGARLVDASSQVFMVVRANQIHGCGFTGFPFTDKDKGRDYTHYYSPVLGSEITSPDQTRPSLTDLTDATLSGQMPSSDREAYPYSVVDLYLLDSDAKKLGRTVPGQFLGSFVEGSTQDMNPVLDEFRFGIGAFAIPEESDLVAVVTYSKGFGSLEADGGSVTGPASNLLSFPAQPGHVAPESRLSVIQDSAGIVVNWKGEFGALRLEASDDAVSPKWRPVFGFPESAVGVNHIKVPAAAQKTFYRLTTP